MPIYPADFLTDERFAFLTLEETGAVFLLLMWQWQNGSIPDDPAKLAIILRVNKTVMSTLYNAIKGAFDEVPGDGQRRNRWLHQAREELLQKRTKMAMAGRAAMHSRWASSADKDLIEAHHKDLIEAQDKELIIAHDKDLITARDKVLITAHHKDLITTPDKDLITAQDKDLREHNITEHNVTKTISPPISPPAHAGGGPKASDEAFALFWDAYPKKRSKGQALKAWKQLRPSKELVDRILAAIEKAKVSPDWTRDGGAYIPYPATWLHAMGWEDDYSQAKPAPANSPPPRPTPTKAEIYARVGGHRDLAPPPPPPKRDPEPQPLRPDPQAALEFTARIERLIQEGEIEQETVDLCLRPAVPFRLLDGQVWAAVPAGALFMAQESILPDLMTAGIRLTTPEEAMEMLALGSGAEDVPEEVLGQAQAAT
jgi:uncharacterized protein YdaU (DUF1376 family)